MRMHICISIQVEDTAENSSNKIPGTDQTQVVSKSEAEERGDKEGGRVGEGEKVGQQVRETGDTRLRESDTPTSVSFLPPSMAPFPHLHTLSLANNMVSHKHVHTFTLPRS